MKNRLGEPTFGPEGGLHQKTTFLRGKGEAKQNCRKSVKKLVASAGDADPGQGGFWGGSQAGRGLVRLRSSSGWAGGFHVLRTDRRAGVGLHSVVAEEKCYSLLIRIWFDVVAIKVAQST